MICVHSEWPIDLVDGSILHQFIVYRWHIQPFARFYSVVQNLCHQQYVCKKGESVIMIVRRWGLLELSNTSENT